MEGEDERVLLRLVAEKQRIEERLKQLNVRSTGRDMLIQRLEMIDAEIAHKRADAP